MRPRVRRHTVLLIAAAVLCGAWRFDPSQSRPDRHLEEAVFYELEKFIEECPPIGLPRGGELSVVEGILPGLKEIFRESGVPPGLVWIAEVESSWNSRAVSRKGAVGLFQFTRATAEEYGLRTGPRDERISPYKSARAAARYLSSLYERFGSWQLALAAGRFTGAGPPRLRKSRRTCPARRGISSRRSLPPWFAANPRGGPLWPRGETAGTSPPRQTPLTSRPLPGGEDARTSFFPRSPPSPRGSIPLLSSPPSPRGRGPG
jgi:hypothetical protein